MWTKKHIQRDGNKQQGHWCVEMASLFFFLTACFGSQGIMWPQVISGAVGNILNGIINYIFLKVLDLGVAWVLPYLEQCTLYSSHNLFKRITVSIVNWSIYLMTHLYLWQWLYALFLYVSSEVDLQLPILSHSIPWQLSCLCTSAAGGCTKLHGTVSSHGEYNV